MTFEELEKQLEQAEGRLNQLLKFPKGVDVNERLRAFEAVSVAQRELAAALGEEHAVPYDIGFLPEAAVSEAVLLQTEELTVLTFRAMRPMSDHTRHEAGYAVIEFELCQLTKFGYPNDEALPGHPLYAKGLGGYGVYEVHNSSWISQITAQNRVRFPHTPKSSSRHFIIAFHDSTFECIARRLRAELMNATYEEVFAKIQQRIFGK